MSFHASSQSVRLEAKDCEKAILHCQCKDHNGHWKDSRIDLDKHIGNTDGDFRWDGANFSKSARNMKVQSEQNGAICTLRAQLKKKDGTWVDDVINLAERIGNANGTLTYQK